MCYIHGIVACGGRLTPYVVLTTALALQSSCGSALAMRRTVAFAPASTTASVYPVRCPCAPRNRNKPRRAMRHGNGIRIPRAGDPREAILGKTESHAAVGVQVLRDAGRGAWG
ncbi:hypothetical protein BD309DRAFT_268789 [Dichomitus squalens]|uniref:Uncharacterized protein n=1 Tax=Dichomitus squalens TaxID=114155 RepID=A0A4Q9NJP9_9APHY|nr:hypothetical protein BD309DRAFT_268789 [Dichomitus squalens]TBU59778.1 hypothetical protein BD310DRAFT_371252 [Dichomitus squalens]